MLKINNKYIYRYAQLSQFNFISYLFYLFNLIVQFLFNNNNLNLTIERMRCTCTIKNSNIIEYRNICLGIVTTVV